MFVVASLRCVQDDLLICESDGGWQINLVHSGQTASQKRVEQMQGSFLSSRLVDIPLILVHLRFFYSLYVHFISDIPFVLDWIHTLLLRWHTSILPYGKVLDVGEWNPPYPPTNYPPSPENVHVPLKKGHFKRKRSSSNIFQPSIFLQGLCRS